MISRLYVLVMSGIARRWFKGPRALHPLHVLEINHNKAATQVIPEHVAPLVIAMNDSMRSENSKSIIPLTVEEFAILVFDGELKPPSRPTQDHHLGH